MESNYPPGFNPNELDNEETIEIKEESFEDENDGYVDDEEENY